MTDWYLCDVKKMVIYMRKKYADISYIIYAAYEHIIVYTDDVNDYYLINLLEHLAYCFLVEWYLKKNS